TTVWIQCEFENCLKWRILTSEDASVVDSNKPWYCNMNPNSSFSSCSVAEERYPEESAFHKYGLKLVYSQLPLGSLVLAKMSGWPSSDLNNTLGSSINRKHVTSSTKL
uniref:CW-type domain-containing protein n=1 Tax=Callorhinchus milii TaxID=7868 RepID=A0A4W3GBP1_CALMI